MKVIFNKELCRLIKVTRLNNGFKDEMVAIIASEGGNIFQTQLNQIKAVRKGVKKVLLFQHSPYREIKDTEKVKTFNISEFLKFRNSFSNRELSEIYHEIVSKYLEANKIEFDACFYYFKDFDVLNIPYEAKRELENFVKSHPDGHYII